MKTLFILAVCAVVFASAGCSSVSVNHDYDPQVNFSQYKTFSWLPIPAKATTNPLVVRRIKDAMTRQLEAKGILLVSQNANFLIAMHGTTQEKLDIQDWGYSSPSAAYWGQRDISIQQYTEGNAHCRFCRCQFEADVLARCGNGHCRSLRDPGKAREEDQRRRCKTARKISVRTVYLIHSIS